MRRISGYPMTVVCLYDLPVDGLVVDRDEVVRHGRGPRSSSAHYADESSEGRQVSPTWASMLWQRLGGVHECLPLESTDTHGHDGGVGAPVAQLAVEVVPPTLDRAPGEQRTGVVSASSDGGHTGEANDVHGHVGAIRR